MRVTRVTKKEAIEILLRHKVTGNNGIFTVVFIKRTNGERRVMNARFGVHKYTKGIGLAYDPKEHALIGCYDMQKEQGEGYRMISTESITELKINGEHYVVDEAI